MLNLPPNEQSALKFQCKNKLSCWWPMSLTQTIDACQYRLKQGVSYYPIIVAWIANDKKQLIWHEVEPFYNDYLGGKMALS